MSEQGWETIMEARLRLLAAADREVEAPTRVEAALRQAFGRQRAVRWARGRRVAAWGAVAASVLVVGALTASRWGRSGNPGVRPSDQVVPAPQTPSRLESPRFPAPPAVRRAPRAARRYNVDARPAPAPAVREWVTEFLPLVDADSLAAEDTTQVVRVRLPRATLASFGLPVNEDQATDRVQADVVLGGDGMARAIRFVREIR